METKNPPDYLWYRATMQHDLAELAVRATSEDHARQNVAEFCGRMDFLHIDIGTISMFDYYEPLDEKDRTYYSAASGPWPSDLHVSLETINVSVPQRDCLPKGMLFEQFKLF